MGFIEETRFSLLWTVLSAPNHATNWLNMRTLILGGTVLGVLAVTTLVCWLLQRQPESHLNPALLKKFNRRVWAWWTMWAILCLSFLAGRTATVILFGFVSFWALREFVTMTPTRRGDHRALFWVFFVFTPIQYLLVALGRDFYQLYTVMIPVYASLFIPARIAVSGDYKRFLERSAKIQIGLLITVYSLSHAPALLDLELTTWKATARPASPTTPANDQVDGEPSQERREVNDDGDVSRRSSGAVKRNWTEGSTAGLLFYFVLIVQLSDVFQYTWGQFLGRRIIAPEINASRSWEGLLGGVATTTLVGALLWWATPFRMWEAACISAATSVMGFAGGMTMSAIKRDRGVPDYGTLVQGHAGVLDRIDSVCFAAPVFFHLTRYFFSSTLV